MRLLTSKASAEERINSALIEGYHLRQWLMSDYDEKHKTATYDPDVDLQEYYTSVNAWINSTILTLGEIFPTDLEANFFINEISHHLVSYRGLDQKFGVLYHQRLPDYINRLKNIQENDLLRYTDLPIRDRLYIEDIDSFVKVRDVNPGMIIHLLDNGFLNQTEDQVQLALEQILGVSFHKKDWGGEINDLYTANLIINGKRHSTAFLLKGPGIGKKEMVIGDCGKNGDQLVRLFSTPADLFVVQYVGPISDMLIKDVQGKIENIRARGDLANFLIIDGQDTARLLFAYGKL
jgi:hypothetical protein